MWKKNNNGQSLPRVGKVASGASRIGFWWYEREGERSSQVRRLREHPSATPKRKPTPPRCARQPLPREGARVDTPSFLWKEVPRRGGGWMGGSGMKKGGEIVSSVPFYESTLSTASAVPLPQWGRLRYEDTAFLASSKRIHAYVEKQYPRQSLPRVGKVASGASRIGFWRNERE